MLLRRLTEHGDLHASLPRRRIHDHGLLRAAPRKYLTMRSLSLERLELTLLVGPQRPRVRSPLEVGQLQPQSLLEAIVQALEEILVGHPVTQRVQLLLRLLGLRFLGLHHDPLQLPSALCHVGLGDR